MKKFFLLFLSVILLMIFIYNANAQTIGFDIILEKPSYLRYEIVSFKVNLTF